MSRNDNTNRESSSPSHKDSNTNSSQDDESLGAVGGTPHHEEKNWKGNFEEQQAMIGHLREMLKQKESSKKQEKEIEDYATRLAKMKPRLLRGKGRGRSREKEDSTPKHLIEQSPKKEPLAQEPTQFTFQNPSSHSSLIVSEVIAEKVSPMPASKSNVEQKELPIESSPPQQESGSRSKILLLRKQLEENRIKFERQQRENIDKRAAMEDMKERIDKLRNEVEQRDTLIQSLQDVDSLQNVNSNVQHLYKQILHKDNTVLELSDKVNQLEGVIHDQREQMNEKDQIIAARTEAVSLISKDKDEKLMQTLQELEDLKSSVREIQDNFISKEEQWRERETLLQISINEKCQKITVMEENYQRIENIRFELSARNAELQEKIVAMQCDSKKLREDCNEARQMTEARNQEADELKRKLNRAEAFGQKKLKALEKQVKMISSEEGDTGSRILELENQIAELEEEKGNLQLKLVDFDDLKIQSEKLSETVANCENKIEQLNSEILTQIAAVTQLEDEKINLVDEVNTKHLKINSLEELAAKHETELEDLKQSKVTVELRLCQVEEERDLALKTQKDFENEQKKASDIVVERDMINRNEDYASEIRKCKSLIEERESSIFELEKLFSEKEILIETLEEEREDKMSENQCLISILAEKESILSAQSIKLEKHDAVVQGLQEEMSSKLTDINNLLIQNQTYQVEIDSLGKKLTESEVIIENLKLNIEKFGNEVETNKNSISLLEKSENALKSTLLERDEALQKMQGDLSYLKNELIKREETISNHISRIEHMDSVLQSREKQILNLESEIADKVRELSQQEVKNTKCEKEIGNLQQVYGETEARLRAECDAISCILADKENRIAVLDEELRSKDVGLKNSEVMYSKFEQELCQKNRLYDELLQEKSHLDQEFSSLQARLQETESQEELKHDVSVLHQSLEEKETDYQLLKNEFDQQQQKSKSQEESFVELKQNLEKEISELRTLYDAKENHCQKIQAEFQNYITNKEQESVLMIQSIAEKESELLNLKESFTSESFKEDDVKESYEKMEILEREYSSKVEELTHLQQQLDMWQHQYSQITDELNNFKVESDYYKTQVEELSSRLEQATQDNLEKINTLKEEKDLEIHELQKEIEDKNTLLIKYNAEISSSKDLSSSSADHVKEFKDHIDQLQSEISLYQTQIDELTKTLDSYKTSYESLYSQYEDLAQQYAINEEEIKNLRSGANSVPLSETVSTDSNQGNIETFEEENKNLKKQLEEAQQAITRLETSLATQSVAQENLQEGVDEWGIVDLGEPSVSDQSLTVQRSLMEKDKALTVIQEQLKIALEEVNAANDDKKIVQHQMKTLEAELSHKEQKISNLDAKVQELASQLTDLRNQHQKFNVDEQGTQTSAISHGFRQVSQTSPSDPDSTSSWFNKAAEGESIGFWEMDENPSLGEDRSLVTTSTNQELALKHPLESTTEPVTGEINSEQAQDQTLQELQYRLSWYEENWATWTEHYSQLQIEHQAAEERLVLLKEELESLKLSTTSKVDTSDYENVKSEKESLEKLVNELKEEKMELEKRLKEYFSQQSMALNNLTSQHESQLKDANTEICRLKGLETQVCELQGQIQTLQHQCSILENKTTDYDENATKVREYEMLYGELQTCMQESETKREGSKSRVQELELMVQSAESEIARLRSDLQNLTTAGNALEGERSSIEVEVGNLKEEIRKVTSEREMYERENDRLQKEAASLHSRSVELQELCERNRGEIDQLKSEIDILEGDGERNRSNYDILESDANRIRHENELLVQSNQIINAEKESLETEVQRLINSNSGLTSERDHIRGEMQRLSEVATSAESGIARLKFEVENLRPYSVQYTSLEAKYQELKDRFNELENVGPKREREDSQELQLEEIDWGTDGKMENEHLQRSSSVEKNLQELQELKDKVIALEKERNGLSEELQTSKLKNAKMIQKLKASNNKNENLVKDMQKLKMKAGGFSDLDLALEKEWKLQVTKAENERDEFKVKVDELEKEKNHTRTQLEVLEMAQEKYIELKESQDDIIKRLSLRNENLASQIVAMEWKITELEESVEQQQEFSGARSDGSFFHKSLDDSSVFEELKMKISSLEEEIQDLKSENSELKKVNEEIQSKSNDLKREMENLRSVMDDLTDAKSKLETNCNTYKTTYLELHTDHETLEENYTKLNKQLEALKYEQTTLKSAYDVLYEEYQQLQENRDSVRLELGITTGERDKLQEEVCSLNNQLQALQEEEEEEIIRALQDECADLREQNNTLKDEITRLNESIRQMEESVERTKQSLDQEVDIQDYLRGELLSKSQHNDSLSTTINEQEQQMKYLKAELASLRAKSTQQMQALDSLEPENSQLKKSLESLKEKNKQLVSQVEVADISLVNLATRGSNEESDGRFSSLEATELEAALSSLHIRDLRCQQLSLEINKLLEERDGLQLKLSAALRQSQDLSRELSLSQQLPSSPQSPAHALSQKLAELRDLNTSLERKALDNFKSGTLPPSPPTFVSHTAPATPTAMRHMDYTVIRENQGASSTIMNWILGKSTPKEVLHV